MQGLSAHMPDMNGEALSLSSLARLAALDLATLPAIEGSPRIGPCVVRPVNFVCIGLNYADHVAGYCVVNGVSEREFQAERGGTWDKGKGCDTFGPTGPWTVTKDAMSDPRALPPRARAAPTRRRTDPATRGYDTV